MTWTPPAEWTKARERFERDTAKHEMTVLHDADLYRHLRFKDPGSSFYWFDIITWPGRLVVCGDFGGYMFTRTLDMFEWFEGSRGEINPDYWRQKLDAPSHDPARVYSYEAFKAHVLEWFRDVSEDLPADEAAALRAALDEQVLDDTDGLGRDENSAHGLLRDFEHDGRRISDSWEWDLREYDWSFLWGCWAIVRGIEQYRAQSREAVVA